LNKLDIGFIGFLALYQSSSFLHSKVVLEEEEERSKEKVDTYNDISIAEGFLSREGRRELEGGTQMKVGNQREPGMNGGLWMMRDGGRDLEGRSWRKGVAESSRVTLKKLEPGYEEGRA
jgi:hypothetical protein